MVKTTAFVIALLAVYAQTASASISFVLLSGRGPRNCSTRRLAINPDWNTSHIPSHLQCFNLASVFNRADDPYNYLEPKHGTPTPVNISYSISLDNFTAKYDYSSIQFLNGVLPGDKPNRALIFYGGLNCTDGAVRFSCGVDNSKDAGYCADLPFAIKSFALAPIPDGESTCVLNAYEKGAYEVLPDGTVVGNVTSAPKGNVTTTSAGSSPTASSTGSHSSTSLQGDITSTSSSTTDAPTGNPSAEGGNESTGQGTGATLLSFGVATLSLVSFVCSLFTYL